MSRGWHKDKYRHALASRGIRTKIDKLNVPIAGLSQDDIVEEFTYRDYPIVVVDSWDFWATWVHDGDIILFDADSYSKLSPPTVQFMLDHEIEEMLLSKDDDEWNKRGHTWYVKKYHEEANQTITHKYSDKIDLIKEDLYNLERSRYPNKEDEEVIEMVEWTTKGLDIYAEDKNLEVMK